MLFITSITTFIAKLS